MKIAKFATIKNMAVFKDFKWDESVRNANTPVLFQRTNVIFGNNYSGKTTLSRIVRAFETRTLSEKYFQASFQLLLDDNTSLTEKDIQNKRITVRVFNEDFIRDNLRFIIDQNSDIQPFAVLGENNAKIEKEITSIKEKLGEDNPDSPTGFYKDKDSARKKYDKAESELSKAKKELDKLKATKATDKTVGIKYNMKRFNQQNYNIPFLEADIKRVQAQDYVSPSKEDIDIYEAALNEEKKAFANRIPKTLFHLSELSEKCQELCERKIGASEKIQELIRNVALEEWVRSGMGFNENRKECAFCGQPILPSRWEILHRHFDKETEKLNFDLKKLDDAIEKEKALVDSAFRPDKEQFYYEFQDKLSSLIGQYDIFKREYIDELMRLKEFVQKRTNNILTDFPFQRKSVDFNYEEIFDQYETLRIKSDSHGNEIARIKANAQERLRLFDIECFINQIDYDTKISNIQNLEATTKKEKISLDTITATIAEHESLLKDKERLLVDEGKGAKKVNQYLKLCFGSNHLLLRAVTSDCSAYSKSHFEVVRNGERAFHLSEGECSLIAFCYFIAKLSDSETKGKKPIIWIDDPISSLDANHIYFAYSLITQAILNNGDYSQLFIATHNLQFLKYIRKLDLGDSKHVDTSRGNFIVKRNGDQSVIKMMPDYLKKHGTEFNHWFENIYLCATQELSDANLHLFENYGNVARRFLETYLFYKYPDNISFDIRLKRFWGDNTIPPLFVRKISDEQSHADGDLENHDLPFVLTEVVDSAKFILDRLKTLDFDQYKSLLSSIGQSV